MVVERITFWTILEKSIQKYIEFDSITDIEHIIEILENFVIHFIALYEDWFQDECGIEYENDAELYEGVILYYKESEN